MSSDLGRFIPKPFSLIQALSRNEQILYGYIGKKEKEIEKRN
jgi:hypothetical protein